MGAVDFLNFVRLRPLDCLVVWAMGVWSGEPPPGAVIGFFFMVKTCESGEYFILYAGHTRTIPRDVCSGTRDESKNLSERLFFSILLVYQAMLAHGPKLAMAMPEHGRT